MNRTEFINKWKYALDVTPSRQAQFEEDVNALISDVWDKCKAKYNIMEDWEKEMYG